MDEWVQGKLVRTLNSCWVEGTHAYAKEFTVKFRSLVCVVVNEDSVRVGEGLGELRRTASSIPWASSHRQYIRLHTYN